ncbi:Fe-S cluster assembly sulfur transfer protein SufU [Butyrivibrio sp. MC2013]|uniref:Fe-S cluster assembly sulfur transfer protein SufU n=1 Tax=Butyrivibrio sp. MC2013 TaxID=1280686 RepID=UPI0004109542|nr:SUF system NifU family Fe-S cluster assembly protein [Butyrivibrio sp. MC2013]
MDIKQLYREIVNEHNLNPEHKGKMEDPTIVLRGVNPSCGDDITLSLKVSDKGIIEDAMFEGSGCAISQASVDIMAGQIVGMTKEEALKMASTFMGMIKGEVTDEEEIESLDEAAALRDVAHMPARVKCAVLGWHTMEKMLNGDND